MRSAVLLHSIASCGHILGSALEGYQSNHNVVYSKYPCVWTPKYRRSVLVGRIAIRCEQIIRQIAAKYQAEILAVEIMPDPVHVLVEVDPQSGIGSIGVRVV